MGLFLPVAFVTSAAYIGSPLLVRIFGVAAVLAILIDPNFRSPLIVLSPWHTVDGERLRNPTLWHWLTRIKNTAFNKKRAIALLLLFTGISFFITATSDVKFVKFTQYSEPSECKAYAGLMREATGKDSVQCSRAPRIFLVGPHSTGKSTIFETMSGWRYPELLIGQTPTTDDVYCATSESYPSCPRPKDHDGMRVRKSSAEFFKNFTLLDSPGFQPRRMRSEQFADDMEALARQSDVLMIVVSIDKLEMGEAQEQLIERLAFAQKRMPVIVVINKCNSGEADCNDAQTSWGGIQRVALGEMHENPPKLLLPWFDPHKGPTEQFRDAVRDVLLHATERRVHVMRRDMAARMRDELQRASFPRGFWRAHYEFARNTLIARDWEQ
eukprot:TRINITY_DN3459_c0_g1_i1.p1 TRINITY_DN3459_c0_g1~~TRINITY_DN3459_c0_g1_i1.p1  ORF type:complete len:428 (+),score=60.52 TRINITY_DN3459_c0_g1_i1:137-1285(+)